MSESIINRIKAIGLMPVISSVRVSDSEKLAAALISGGIPVAEVTFRMENAELVIAAMRKAYPEMLVGAGTVTSLELAQKAIAAGAQFLVSPGLNPKVVSFCREAGVVIIPGVATPSEIELAMELGLETVKFFPSEQSGGLPAIKALCGPYKGIGFMPTGGINLKNLAEYLAYDRVVACGGTYMLGNYASSGEWDKISELCRISLRTMLGLQLGHIGIPALSEMDGHQAADAFASLLQLECTKEGKSSVFVGDWLEIMKIPSRGQNGHLGIKTTSINRAVNYFTAMGVEFDEKSAKYDIAGRLKAIYFKKEINGFALHLMRG